jgi:helicase
MRQSLRTWIADADTRQNVEQYGLQTQLPGLDYQDGRTFDLYVALVGELFDLLRVGPEDTRDWAALGNAFSQAARTLNGAAQADATLFSAASFYSGGYAASAYVAMRQSSGLAWNSDTYRACYDFLARPARPTSDRVRGLLDAMVDGSIESIEQAQAEAEESAREELNANPDEWVAQRIYASLLARFSRTNLRAVLPDGASARWNPLIASLRSRPRPVWDFFPSQITAIEAGLLTSREPFSMQMPTGAGKTALTETLLFSHLINRRDDLAVLLVPYRALARELRGSVAERLSRIGLPTRTVYGGTVPTHEETQDLDELRAIIATPEALTGLLGSAPELVPRISLVVCDEGHLLDQDGRGVGLELLLARLLGRQEHRPRTVFVSAIVPNIEEINSWLGGSDQTVVRSTFRPAEAEYAVLRSTGSGALTRVGLEMQSVDSTLQAHTLPDFLQKADFRYLNPRTGRHNTYSFTSIKTQAIAAARKSLALGTVAVFSATKTGNQGVVGLAEELLSQLEHDLPIPLPIDSVSDRTRIEQVSDYFSREFGTQWVGTRALRVGAVVHHGDISQEAREAVEELLADGQIRMVLCTSTLAEGVNLPIRTLVLYAVQRRTATGTPIPMLARDIRNLVGRAGRAGSSTKGLVICASPTQWAAVKPVATGQPGEDVRGALLSLVERLRDGIRRGITLSNTLLEEVAELYPLTDGVDSTLLELLHDEIGAVEFREIAATLAAHTFAAQQLDQDARDLLAEVFTMRSARIADLRSEGRLGWIRETGARVRLVDSVVDDLAPLLDDWSAVESPLDSALIDAFLKWAYQQPDFQRDLRESFPNNEHVPPQNLPAQAAVRDLVTGWISGDTFTDIATATDRTVDGVLRIYGSVISYSLATLTEQAAAILQRHLADSELTMSEAVALLPEYLRHGVPTPAARTLMIGGVRHRRAAVLLGNHPAMTAPANVLREPRDIARDVINEAGWQEALGQFVFQRTQADLGEAGPSADPGGGPRGGSPATGPGGPGAGAGDRQVVRGEVQSDGWSDVVGDVASFEVIDYVRGLLGNSLPMPDAERIVRSLLKLALPDGEIDRVVADLGDVIVTATRAVPMDFPLVAAATVREYDYGMRLVEVTVDFDADLELSLSPSIARHLLSKLHGYVAYGGEESELQFLAVRLRCVALVRSEHEHAEIAESSIDVVDS